MTAVAIDFNRIASSFTRGATIFAALLGRATTYRVTTLVLIVCHGILLKNVLNVGR